MSIKRISKLGAATVAAGGLTAGLLAATTVTAQAADIDADHIYDCVVRAGGLPLGTHEIGVNTQVEVPDSVMAGESIPSRLVDITLTLPEGLRAATYNFVGGRKVEGSSDNTTLDLVVAGQTQTIPILELASLAPVDIPSTAGTPWQVPAQGTVPTIPVPEQAFGNAEILMPQAFLVDATVYKADESTVPATMDCTVSENTPAYRHLATVPIETETAVPVAADVTASTAYGTAVPVTLSATDEDSEELTYAVTEGPANGTLSGEGAELTYTPNDDFAGTDTFTYTATDEAGQFDTATATITVAKASSKTKATAPKKPVKAGKTAKIAVKVTSPATAAGKVTVKLGKKTVASGTVKNGKATVKIAGKQTKKLKGKKTFTVAYAGSSVVKASSAKVKISFKK